ncbi:cell division protein FtsX [Sphingomonas phyllosphaerae]|uniref:cell division protein FtsX n=1 Tax=Sphingomonas phyllosphaerae TaxID=257003 RepID=UPI0004245754|nr:FtsX-like permease family protein [Sphingomonas phyllosphaerae]
MTAATARLLDTARDGWTMTGVLAVMIFLAVLATASGVGTATAGRALGAAIEGQVTVQLVSGDAATRARRATQAVAALRRLPGVSRVTPVSRVELARLLGPWLGSAAGEDDLPVPALIDVTVVPSGEVVGKIRRIVAPLDPAMRIDAHGLALEGTRALLKTVTLLAAAIVALMIAAGMAMVLLATRAGLTAHQLSIEVMHRLGATDGQVATLFCRRMARDAALAAVIGAPTAWGVILLLGQAVAGSGAQLLGGMTLGRAGWGVAIALPIAFVALAALVAYLAVRRALGRLT